MCDLTDPRILETYTAVVEDEPTNWFILGYHDTRDVISLYSKGTEGLSEFRNNLSDQVLYGFVRVEDRFILITWVSEQVSGVRRARALVHSRSVAALLKAHHAQITASTLNDLSDANIRTRLKLGDGQTPRRSTSQKRISRRQSTQSPTSPTTPSLPTSPTPPPVQQDEFVEASETLPTHETAVEESIAKEPIVEEKPPIVVQDISEEETQYQLEQQRLAFAQQQKQEELQRKRLEEEQRLAQVAAAEQEATRLAAEKEANDLRLKQEQIQREQAEAERVEQEKRLLQQRLLEAEKNKDVILSGYVSVQPSSSPFWRRRYFTIKGKSMAFYRDELTTQPVTVLDLSQVIRLNNVNVDIETFVPNAFVLETQQHGAYQLFADDKKEMETVLTALQTVI